MKKIKKYFYFFAIIVNIYGGENPHKTKLPIDYVNPFICTQGDHGQWLPAANVPFGLIELCPDTYPGSLTANGDFAHSGYDYSDNNIRGFSHFHRGSSGGTRVCDRAGLLSIIPYVNVPSDTFFVNPVIEFDKKSETARPGYYSVRLVKDNILAELTASAHSGYHRYTFAESKSAQLFLYEGNRSRSRNISCHLADKRTIEGVQSVYNGIYFVMKFNCPVKSTMVWDGKKLVDGNALNEVTGGGFVCQFGNLNGKTLEVRVGVSLVSIKAARANLRSENSNFDFKSLQNKAAKLWEEKINKIRVDGNEEYKTIFYTALYHTCFLPVTITDDDGTYPGLDKNFHNVKGYTHLDDYSFWDSFRTKYPLYSLYLPEIYRDIVKSLRDIYEQADWDKPDLNHKPHEPGSGFNILGKNRFSVYDNCRNEHMLMIMTDAYFKGLYDNDIKINSIYPYLKREALVQMNENMIKSDTYPDVLTR